MGAVRRLPRPRFRPLVLSVVLVTLPFAACEGATTVARPSPSRSAGTPTTSPAPSPAPSGTPDPATPSPTARPLPPAWATPIEQDLAPDAVPDEALVPPGAMLTERVTLPAAGGIGEGIAVTYVIGDDPFAAEHGFALWQRFAEAPAWSVVLAFVRAPSAGVLGIRLEAGDLTGDAYDELLTFEDRGGSGACGVWRVLSPGAGSGREIFRRATCDTQIRIAGPTLEVREAVFEPGDPHCCPSAFRLSSLRWNGSRFRETASEVVPAGT
jgi:hypothetical protein